MDNEHNKFQGKHISLISESTGKTFQISLEGGHIKIKAENREEESYKISDLTSIDSGPTKDYGIRTHGDDWGDQTLAIDLRDDYRTFSTVTVDTASSTFHVPDNIRISKGNSLSSNTTFDLDGYDFF